MVKAEDTLNKWTLLSLDLFKALHKEHFIRPHTLKCECEITLTSDLSQKCGDKMSASKSVYQKSWYQMRKKKEMVNTIIK